MENNAVSVVCINSLCEEKLVGHNVQQKSPISAPLLFGHICYYKYINWGSENKLEILRVFYVPEKVVKLTKNKITKIEENLKESEKHSLKCVDISYMACYWEF